MVRLLQAAYRSAMLLKASQTAANKTWVSTLAEQSRRLGLNQHAASLRICDAISTPVLVGIFRPCILLPRHVVDSSSRTTQEQILTHELIHIQRNDVQRNMLLQVVVALWWWHPLVHWMQHKTRVLREMICDASTSSQHEPEAYAETLLGLATQVGTPHALALRFSSSSHSLERRVAWILSRPTSIRLRKLTPRFHRSIFLATCICALIATTFRITYVSADESKETPNQASLAKESQTDAQPQDKPLETSNSVEVTAENISKLPPLQSGPTVKGVVLSPDGQPAANVDVYLLELPDGAYILPTKPHKTVTDSRGKFEYQGMPEKVYQIWAESKDLISHFELLRGLRVAVKSTPTNIDPISFKLHPGCSFRIKVIEASTGKAISGVSIKPSPQDIERESITDEKGIAFIQNLSSIPWKFLIHKPDLLMKSLPLTSRH